MKEIKNNTENESNSVLITLMGVLLFLSIVLNIVLMLIVWKIGHDIKPILDNYEILEIENNKNQILKDSLKEKALKLERDINIKDEENWILEFELWKKYKK